MVSRIWGLTDVDRHATFGYLPAMRPRVVISTPFPSVREVAAAYGVPDARVRAITRLVEAIHAGHDVSHLESLRDVWKLPTDGKKKGPSKRKTRISKRSRGG